MTAIPRFLLTALQRFPDHVQAFPARGSRRANDRRPATIEGRVPDEWAKDMRDSARTGADVYLVVRVERNVWESITRAKKASGGVA